MLKWILILATVLRLAWLTHTPPSLNWDEVSMGYTAYSLSETGRDEWGERLPLLFRSYGEWKSAVYIYLLVPFIRVLGPTELAVRLPSALAGILAVYLTYLIGTRLYSRRVGLWAAFFLSISPWHLVLSRPAFEANVALTLVLAGIYLFLKSSLKDRSLLFLSGLFFALAPHTYNSAKVVVPLLTLCLIWKSQLYKKATYLLVFALPLLLFALPLLLNLFTGRTAFRYTQVGVTTDQEALARFVNNRQLRGVPPELGKLVFNRYTYAAHATLNNYLTYLSPAFLLAEAGDHTQHHVPYFGVLYLAEFGFLLYGLSALSKERSVYRALPLVLIALGILPAALTRDEGHVLRSILTLPGWQLLAALGVTSLKSSKLVKWLTGILIIQAVVFVLAYFWWYPRAFARDWQYGHKEVAAYLKAHESEYQHIVMTKWYGEPQLFLAFYNRWDPRWYQQENRANLRYETEGRLWLDQLPKYSIGKYTFTYLDLANHKMEPGTLYIGKFDDFFEDPRTLSTIHFPDGSVAFHLVEGQ